MTVYWFEIEADPLLAKLGLEAYKLSRKVAALKAVPVSDNEDAAPPLPTIVRTRPPLELL